MSHQMILIESNLRAEAFCDIEQISTFVQSSPASLRVSYNFIDPDDNERFHGVKIVGVTALEEIRFDGDDDHYVVHAGKDMRNWFQHLKTREFEDRIIARLKGAITNTEREVA